MVLVHDWPQDYSSMTGTIDCWWLVDDGGLALLLPWILTRKKAMRNLPMRVLTVVSDISSLYRTSMALENLIKGMRIDASVIIATPDDIDTVTRDDLDTYHRQNPHMDRALDARTLRYCKPCLIFGVAFTDVCLLPVQLSKMMRAHSKDAALVFCSLPVPRPEVPAVDWLSWLDLIAHDMPPVVFIRGNQQNVLSYAYT